MKPFILILLLALTACDDDSPPEPMHFAKHGKLLFSADEIVNAVR